ncbi:hypothetical protein GWI33_007487 [Rhynchophorus ferrugineus]|uniref:Uncharacterized protein n=1 Tax=Rhynchophorus ferrugineus TaxID=354439 RepID=A0A834IK64_RHYFE|nr:hypothetical protein GWI33_007487 [Rhynchophorus ferrugineus]
MRERANPAEIHLPPSLAAPLSSVSLAAPFLSRYGRFVFKDRPERRSWIYPGADWDRLEWRAADKNGMVVEEAAMTPSRGWKWRRKSLHLNREIWHG